jgi:hypothetical protein
MMPIRRYPDSDPQHCYLCGYYTRGLRFWFLQLPQEIEKKMAQMYLGHVFVRFSDYFLYPPPPHHLLSSLRRLVKLS